MTGGNVAAISTWLRCSGNRSCHVLRVSARRQLREEAVL